MQSPPDSAELPVVLAVSSNKGGVGKTTVASNLAIYLRALREDLPVLLVGLDDQRTLDRMFQLREPQPGEPNLKHGWAERSLNQVIQLGQYGVHFVPSPPDLTVLKARAEDPNTLSRILDRTEWPGIVILDTKSDLEALTKNAYHAADRIIIPVSDRASLEEAAKIFVILDKAGLPREIARVLFTLVDRRTRLADGERHLFRRLLAETQERGWPYYKTYLSRSPRVESLNSGTGTPLSILHHGKGTAVHDQLRALANEVLLDLGLSECHPALLDSGPDELWGRRSRAGRASEQLAVPATLGEPVRGLGPRIGHGGTMSRFGILVGGGPAPGINGVIGAAATRARRLGHEVLGIFDGFEHIMEGNTSRTLELHERDVARIHLQGGSILHTSRANPTKKPGHLEAVNRSLEELGVDYLITIGGDDTASSAHRVSQASERLKLAHVPKTIDNDLPLPEGIPTFGFETAREHGTAVVERLLLDMETTNRWFFVVMMGRSAGHLALGAGKSAGAPITIIPEEFPTKPIRLDDVVRVLEGAIVKRRVFGRVDGVAIIAEGIVEYMADDDPMLADVPRDDHGHIRLPEVPIARTLRTAVREALAKRGVKVTIGEKDVGYELRCGYPTAFDRDYTRDLGAGAVDTLLGGHSSVLVTRQAGRIVPVPFEDIIDPSTQKSRVRGVDIESESYKTAVHLQERITQQDLDDPEMLAAIAKEAGLTPEQAAQRYRIA